MKNLYLAPECIGNTILFDIKPNYYDEANVRQEFPVGYKYSVVLPGQQFEKLQVKIPGPQSLEAPLSGHEPMVEFVNLKVKPYVDSRTGRLAFSASATGIKVVGSNIGTDGKGKNAGV